MLQELSSIIEVDRALRRFFQLQNFRKGIIYFSRLEEIIKRTTVRICSYRRSSLYVTFFVVKCSNVGNRTIASERRRILDNAV